ncbi:MAG: hypothetical protein WD059_13530 [Balneolaceae bacterium]
MCNHRFVGLVIIVSVFISACNLLSVENRNFGDYPTLFPRLDISELEQMNSEYQSSNDGHICSTLNAFGFTGYSDILFPNGESLCLSRDIIRVEINFQDTLLRVAKEILINNSKYTGVEDSSKLQISEIMPLYGCTICDGPDVDNVPVEWKLTFAEQKIDSLTIEDTSITVFIDAGGVNRIWGNWYTDFNEPEFINYGYQQVQNGMVGWQIDMRNYTGQEIIYTIGETNLKQKPYLTYLPVEREEGLEIRKCWVVPVDYNSKEFDGWLAYVDVIDGILYKLKSSSIW